MRLALLISAAIITPALGLAVALGLACRAVERARERRRAPRAGSDVRPGGDAARPLTGDEAARREVLSDWRRTSFDPPGGIDA